MGRAPSRLIGSGFIAVRILGAGLVASVIHAGAARAAEPARSGTELKIEVTPDHLEIGTGAIAVVRVTAPLETDAVQIGVNVGRIIGVRALGPGRLEARYEPPTEPFPHVALIAAVAGDLAAVLPFPLHGTGVTEVETGRRTDVTLHVAGRVFGPKSTDAAGHVTFEVVVPPGVRTGYAVSVDRYGHTSERDVDLAPPEYPRLLLMAGDPLEVAPGAVEVPLWAFTLGESGRLSSAEPPGLDPEEGEVTRPHPLALGVWKATWRLASTDTARSVRTAASVGSEPLRTMTDVRVLVPARSAEPPPVAVVAHGPASPGPLPAPVAGRAWRLIAHVGPMVSANLVGFVAGGAVLGVGLKLPPLAGAFALAVRSAVVGNSGRGVGQLGNTLLDVNVRTVVAPLWLEASARLPRARISPELFVGGGLAWVHRRFRSPLQPNSSRLDVAPAFFAGIGVSLRYGPGTLAARLRYGYANPGGETPNVLGLLAEVGYRFEL